VTSFFYQFYFIQDEDECLSETAYDCQGQAQGRCMNIPGSYRCNCSGLVGFTESTDGKSCV